MKEQDLSHILVPEVGNEPDYDEIIRQAGKRM